MTPNPQKLQAPVLLFFPKWYSRCEGLQVCKRHAHLLLQLATFVNGLKKILAPCFQKCSSILKRFLFSKLSPMFPFCSAKNKKKTLLVCKPSPSPECCFDVNLHMLMLLIKRIKGCCVSTCFHEVEVLDPVVLWLFYLQHQLLIIEVRQIEGW